MALSLLPSVAAECPPATFIVQICLHSLVSNTARQVQEDTMHHERLMVERVLFAALGGTGRRV